jgi:glyoxylase-like metal-dependent hydrolase (beta-lactamase superfamily II)
MRITTFAASVAATIAAGAPAAQEAPMRAIEELKPGFFRAQDDEHYTVFLVTSEGIILCDPISTDFARWLRDELARRFDAPVRYVLYSHHHWDHASGGAVFADSAEIVGHQAMPAKLELPAPGTPFPAWAARADVDGDGRIERGETTYPVLANYVELHDVDGDGALSGAEVVRGPMNDVRAPQRLFADRTTITLGGKSVEMIHVGPTHAEDMTVLRFPAEDAVLLVDFFDVMRLAIPGEDLEQLDAALAKVDELDFSMVVGGHGSVGDKSDVIALRRYLGELRTAVADGIAKGQTLEQLQATLTFDAYRNWANYREWRTENIEAMHAILTSN